MPAVVVKVHHNNGSRSRCRQVSYGWHASLFKIILFAAGISLVGDRGLYRIYEAAICPFHLLRGIVFMLDR